MTLILIPASVGELVDKITILKIKHDQLTNPGQLLNVKRELKMLLDLAQHHAIGFPDGQLKQLGDDLSAVNSQLWGIEDEIRDCERQEKFDAHFIDLARAVYQFNDRRAALKHQINRLTGSELIEEKSYATY